MAFTTRPELLGTFGMVASTHWLASSAGMRTLELGGNAADAAVTAGFVLQVVEPHLNGIGGEAVILTNRRGSADVTAYCGQGPAPRRATIEHFQRLGLRDVPGTGPLAACVPGALDVWLLLLLEQGTMHLRDVLDPAIGYAERGYPVIPRITGAIDAAARLFREEWTSSAEIYLPDGRPPAPGSIFKNTALAATLQRILAAAESAGADREVQIAAARDCFYRGPITERMVEYSSRIAVYDTSGERHVGVLELEDFAAYQATAEPALSFEHAGHTVHKSGIWSQGPVMLQQLALLEDLDLARLVSPGHDEEFVHTVAEAAKLAFADRDAWYGDPAVVPDATSFLLSAAYNAERRRLISDRASLEHRPGRVDGRDGRILESMSTPDDLIGTGEPTLADLPARPGDTCQVNVIDRHGNTVAATPSGGWLQSSAVIPGLGFCLGSRLQMAWLDAEHPSGLRPGTRPRTTLTPTIVLKDGEPALAYGTPGGDRQDQWSVTFLLRVLHGGLNLQEAIDAPMFHTDHLPRSFFPRIAEPGSLSIESRFPEATIAGLRERGHLVKVQGPWSLGRLSAVGRDAREGLLRAGANPRGMQGYAVGR